MADTPVTTMTDELITLLSTFKYPVYRQGSIAGGQAYPDTFITFWGNEDEAAAYDNETQIVEYDFDVNVYSTDPDRAYSLLDEIRTALKGAGYVITNRGYDAQSDEITHVGRGMEVAYLKTEH